MEILFILISQRGGGGGVFIKWQSPSHFICIILFKVVSNFLFHYFANEEASAQRYCNLYKFTEWWKQSLKWVYLTLEHEVFLLQVLGAEL